MIHDTQHGQTRAERIELMRELEFEIRSKRRNVTQASLSMCDSNDDSQETGSTDTTGIEDLTELRDLTDKYTEVRSSLALPPKEL